MSQNNKTNNKTNKAAQEIKKNNGAVQLQLKYQDWTNLVNAVNNNTTLVNAIKEDIRIIYEKLKLYNEKLDFLQLQLKKGG